MTIHQCPKCELRFTWKTERDDHCANDHPQFKHEYPVRKPATQQRSPGESADQSSGSRRP
jgi:hypothetical protein